MNKTPQSNRTHIGIFGKRNAGKSSLMNGIMNQNIAIVSEIKGTTTDPVIKSMELLPYGPVVFIDTAGLDDSGTLGELRRDKSLKILNRIDVALYIMDSTDLCDKDYLEFKEEFKKREIPYMLVLNKIDLLDDFEIERLKEKYNEAIFVTTKEFHSIVNLKEKLINFLSSDEKEPSILGDLLNYGDTVVMVVPIDSEAPKGRIILPQVQVIRDCLDHGIKSYVVRDTELESALKDLDKVDLVITDSQAFKSVNKIVPENILLTSFSILFARYKSGDLLPFLKGIDSLKSLNKNSKILISEACTHNTSHEDIGQVKIPEMIKKYLGFKPNIDVKMGHDFPSRVSDYDLIIHCGACMVNPKTVKNRIRICDEENVSITNYGLIIAFFTGILDRSIEILKNKSNVEKKIKKNV